MSMRSTIESIEEYIWDMVKNGQQHRVDIGWYSDDQTPGEDDPNMCYVYILKDKLPEEGEPDEFRRTTN